jgi:hypothetical protein
MRALLWKDYRLNHGLLVVAAVLLFAPYVVILALAVRDRLSEQVLHWQNADVLALGSTFSMLVSQVSLIILSGNAIACERSDRSTEFLAALPPTRGLVLASKMTVFVTAVTVIWAVNAIAFHIIAPAFGPISAALFGPRDPFWPACAAMSALFSGAGWFWSARLDSPAIAISHGIATIVLGWLALFIALTLGMGLPQLGDVGGMCILLGLGIVLFGNGCLHYLRTVEP